MLRRGCGHVGNGQLCVEMGTDIFTVETAQTHSSGLGADIRADESELRGFVTPLLERLKIGHCPAGPRAAPHIAGERISPAWTV